MKKHTLWTTVLLVATGLTMPAAEPAKEPRLVREVRHELRTLPNYGVFDNLEYSVNGNTVILVGMVTRPTLKAAAENAVKEIEGVEKVENLIEVLPLSSQDDRIRLDAYRAIYGHPVLSRYGLNAVLPIHIVVKNGDIQLFGAVATELDKTVAGSQVSGIPGGHSVLNKLSVDAPEEK
jgi:osmotically-inducible protein OsmY